MDPRPINVRIVASKTERANGRMALEVTLSDGRDSVCADGITAWVRPSEAALHDLFEQWLQQARNGVRGFVEL